VAELYALQSIVEPLRELGATLVAVSPQQPQHGLSIVEKHHLDFDILSDPHNDYARALGLRFTLPAELQAIYASFGIDLPLFDGDDSWTLPMPGRIVIDPRGVVRAVDVDPDYTVRPEPDATLAVVREICRRA
jgi:peroxiredoxin